MQVLVGVDAGVVTKLEIAFERLTFKQRLHCQCFPLNEETLFLSDPDLFDARS